MLWSGFGLVLHRRKLHFRCKPLAEELQQLCKRLQMITSNKPLPRYVTGEEDEVESKLKDRTSYMMSLLVAALNDIPDCL